jgi:hypothetical protein
VCGANADVSSLHRAINQRQKVFPKNSPVFSERVPLSFARLQHNMADDSDDDMLIVSETPAPPPAPPASNSARERAAKRPLDDDDGVEVVFETSNKFSKPGAGAGRTGRAAPAAAASSHDPPLFRLLKTRVSSTQTREALL